MSLDLVGLPCEIRFKIFDHVSVADLTKWLKIQKLRDSILAFLEDEGRFSFRKKFMVRDLIFGPFCSIVRGRSFGMVDGPRQTGLDQRRMLERKTIKKRSRREDRQNTFPFETRSVNWIIVC